MGPPGEVGELSKTHSPSGGLTSSVHHPTPSRQGQRPRPSHLSASGSGRSRPDAQRQVGCINQPGRVRPADRPLQFHAGAHGPRTVTSHGSPVTIRRKGRCHAPLGWREHHPPSRPASLHYGSVRRHVALDRGDRDPLQRRRRLHPAGAQIGCSRNTGFRSGPFTQAT